MPESTEGRLRQVLHRAVPPAPEISYSPPPRRVPAAAMAAVLVLLVAVPFLLWAGGEEPSGVSGGPRKPLPALTCPGEGEGVRGPVDGLLPEDAVSARICGGEYAAPADGLTSAVGDLVAWVNARPPLSKEAICRLDARPPFLVLLQYADGRRLAVQGETSGCQGIQAGPVRRTGGPALLAKYVDLLRAQRAVSPVDPPADLEAPACAVVEDPARVSVAAWHPELVAARMCVRDEAGALVSRVVLDAAQLEGVRTGLEPASSLSRCARRSPGELVGITARREVVVLREACDYWTSPTGEAWAPRDLRVGLMLNGLIG